MRPSGLRVMSTPATSARDSRRREIASCIALAAKGGEDDENQGEGHRVDLCAAVIVAAASAQPTKEQHSQSEVGEQGHESDEGDGDGADEDVVVTDVAELVSEDSFELGAVHQLE